MNRFQFIPFTDVRIDDHFWNERLRMNREVSIPYQYEQCRETGRIDAFRLQWKPGQGPAPHIFWDSDVAKWVEAASYCFATNPEPELGRLLDEVTSLIASAQQPDGYLHTHFTQVGKENRWTNLRDNHELYCAGHLIEAGVVHFQATGQRTLLDAVCRYADDIDSVFGREEGKKRGYCGHEEIELALVRLYHVTGERRYLNLSHYFVDERGSDPCYFELEAKARKEASTVFPLSYYQAHLPVREQTTVIGHAVRAVYLYCAMADLAVELSDPTLLRACERIWENLCRKRMYITGGIGNSKQNEGFTQDYELPNETAYCETCASVALIMWNQRLLRIESDGRYADVLERTLYNALPAGVSLDGKRFFYENPLASRGDHHRQAWFGCACCPSNLSRLFASLGQYIFSRNSDELAVHLYIQSSTLWQKMADASVRIVLETRYPWEGRVRLRVETDREAEFTLRLRIPAWCRTYQIRIAEKPSRPPMEKGYALIRRKWQSGETVEMEFEMPVERIVTNPVVLSNNGRIALQRGPIVYCVEDADLEISALDIILPPSSKLKERWDPGLLGGVVVIEGEALVPLSPDKNHELYQKETKPQLEATPFRAIPYCVWDNRQAGAMSVWIKGQEPI
jgi:DUF1680 family protein